MPTGLRQSLDTNEVRRIIDYISEEVRRQGRGPTQVGWMTQAWMDAIQDSEDEMDFHSGVLHPPTLDNILYMGNVIEPEINPPDQRGDPRWRDHDIFIGANPGMAWQSVPYAMEEWHDKMLERTPAENYMHFELIHPFGDGNGRAGKIIFNWLNQTLRAPVWPPDFFGGIENP